jgi:hypothetical protein
MGEGWERSYPRAILTPERSSERLCSSDMKPFAMLANDTLQSASLWERTADEAGKLSLRLVRRGKYFYNSRNGNSDDAERREFENVFNAESGGGDVKIDEHYVLEVAGIKCHAQVIDGRANVYYLQIDVERRFSEDEV